MQLPRKPVPRESVSGRPEQSAKKQSAEKQSAEMRAINEKLIIAAVRQQEVAETARTDARHGRQDAVLEERTRLAQEIHDTLAQGFAGIITQMEAAEAALANVPDPASPESLLAYRTQLDKVKLRVGKARGLARESLDEARRSVAALRSPPLEEASLSEALASFLTQSVMDTAAKSRYVLDGVPRPLPGSVEHCLLRIGQAAIANAVEHAQAREIVVELCFESGQVRLRVRDDGQGFDPQCIGAGRFGIVGMRERAEKLRCVFSIVSRLGQGTEVSLTVPVTPNMSPLKSPPQR